MCYEERFFDGWSRVIAARFFLLMHLFTATWWQQGEIHWNQKPIQPWIDIGIPARTSFDSEKLSDQSKCIQKMLVEDI